MAPSAPPETSVPPGNRPERIGPEHREQPRPPGNVVPGGGSPPPAAVERPRASPMAQHNRSSPKIASRPAWVGRQVRRNSKDRRRHRPPPAAVSAQRAPERNRAPAPAAPRQRAASARIYGTSHAPANGTSAASIRRSAGRTTSCRADGAATTAASSRASAPPAHAPAGATAPAAAASAAPATKARRAAATTAKPPAPQAPPAANNCRPGQPGCRSNPTAICRAVRSGSRYPTARRPSFAGGRRIDRRAP